MWMIAFDEIFIDKTKYGVKVQTSEYGEQGKHIIIDQGQTQIAGYTDREDGLFEEVPVVIFGDHTRVIKYVDEPFFLGADGVKVLRSKDNNANYKYLYYALKNAKIPNTGYNRHFKWLKEVIIKYPDRERQDEIVEILDKVSDVIQKRQDELSRLDNLIKARFVELFGLPVSNTKGWKTEQMGEVAPAINYKGEFDDEVWLLNLDMVEAQTGRILDYLVVSEEEVGNSTCTFDTSNVLYSKLRPYLNKVVIPDRCGYATSELVPLQPVKTKINREYLAFMLRSDEFVNMINEKVAGAKMPRVPMGDFRKFDVPVPPMELQEQFADFVKQVDKSKFDTMTFAPIYAIINLYLHAHFYQGRR